MARAGRPGPRASTVARTFAVAALALAASCTSGSGTLVLLDLGAAGPVDQFELFVRDDATRKIVLSTGWTDATSNGARDLSMTPLRIALEPPGAGSFSIVAVGVIGPLDGNKLKAGSQEFFWATTVALDGETTLTGRMLAVPAKDDQDGDLFPDAVAWPVDVPDATAIPIALLDCDDKTDYPAKKVFAAQINPFATEVCGDGVDEDCNGDDDEACVDSDGDGDPDSTDCKPMDPKIHHPITDPQSAHYDPFPQSANCCGYNLGKVGADSTKSFADAPICHAGSCGDNIDQDCSGADVACVKDQDCDTYPASAMQPMGCSAPANQPPGLDCDDCNAAINPSAAEICDGLDNNCNGATDETCVGCDLDGDGFQRSDAPNGCPDASYAKSGKAVDCNDEDAGVFPGSTGTLAPCKVPFLVGPLATCGGTEGGSVCGAMRGLCRNLATDGTTHQDADCDGTPQDNCPAATCDADGDGFIDGAKAAMCDPKGEHMPYDCDDADPHTFPNAPSLCGETMPHNCLALVTCTLDADHDGYIAADDCNDADPTMHPWATELCDGIDNDCDGLTDEGNPDETGAAMVEMGHITYCNDSGIGECAKAPVGHCICSASTVSPLHFDQASRKACPGEDDGIDHSTASKARCYGAHQPAPQTCDPNNPIDDDCDGRVDAPDGKNFPQVGMPCWPGAIGQCAPTKGGKITACDMSRSNCFAARGVNPWLVCDNTEICPVAEKCNNFDDDCDGNIPVNETDVDGDGYAACGSQYGMYSSGQPCEAMLNGLVGCGDCADSVGVTMGVSNNQIHPGQSDLCDGVDNDCNPGSTDGASDCPGPKPAEICCGQNGCKDPANDVNNCNGCGITCVEPNGTPQCVAAACAVKVCNASFANCDMTPANGCEINTNTDPTHCGGCANNCSSNNIAAPTCAGGICGGNCNANFLDCNGNKLGDGCEVNSLTDATHCGGCANSCSAINIAAPTCTNGICSGLCNGGFLDCDGNKLTNGCEINGQADPTHCGGCANVCSANNIAAPTCAGGICAGNCNNGFGDCDGNKLNNGCETNLTNSIAHCGGCATNCTNNAWPNVATYGCSASACTILACNANFADCDGNAGSGCEVNITQPTHCGSCGNNCTANNWSQVAAYSCAGATCGILSCSAGFANCNGANGDGCETDITLAANCGACGNNCAGKPAGHACVAGACGCTGDSDCGGAAPRCNLGTHLCQQCSTGADCSPASPKCVAGSCSGPCTVAADCTASGFGVVCGPPCGCNTSADCTNPRTDTCSANSCICTKTGAVCPVGKTCTGAGCV